MKQQKRPATTDTISGVEDNHPIFTLGYIIPTPAIIEMASAVVKWVGNRVPGFIVCGPPRRGKTKALKVLVRELQKHFPGLETISFSAWDCTVPSERAFIEELLTASGHSMTRGGAGFDKRQRLIGRLVQLGKESGHNRVLLIVDEAQNLHEKHYNWLIGISNQMAASQVDLSVLLVGQKELLDTRDHFINTNRLQIVGRFMVHEWEFSGLTSEDDVACCLKHFDDSKHPVGSEWTFTRRFAQGWYDAGHRLHHHADVFWSALHVANRMANHQFDGHVPMQYFCRTVEGFLKEAAKTDLQDQQRFKALVDQSVAESGLPEALGLKWRQEAP
jgi:hypothetical protein